MAEENEFEPRLGRMRSGGGKRARKYLGRVLAAANLAGGGALGFGSRKSGFTGSRIGRGAGVGRVLAARGSRSAYSARRVVVKASLVRLAGKGASGAVAHLRYLQRDGATREGAPGALYGAETDVADGKAFHVRCADDRHQFRFIVSAEDGAEYDDLKPLTRRLMTRVEEDLGTKLDWVAVDHFNTGHPHTHIVVRGKDHLGADLIIARDYLTTGMRERASELVELDLGPRTTHDIEAGLRTEVEQERLTSLDRAMLREAGEDRIVTAAGGDAFAQALRAGRLAKLRQLGLAEPVGGARWQLGEGMEDTLRGLGERGDIIRTMQREIGRAGLSRAPADQAIYRPAAANAAPLLGQIVARGLADEHADRHYLLVDATDGRTHYVVIGKGAELEAVPQGAIVHITPVRAEIREVDRTIVAVAAANGGRYDVEAHLKVDPGATEAFAGTHVRRLEAIRRLTGGAARDAAGLWTIGEDHLDRVAAYEARLAQDRPVAVEILSTRPLAALVEADAATWLDRGLVADWPETARDAGFGSALRDAQERRRQWLIAQDLAEVDEGVTRYRAGLLATLQRRELLRVAGALADETGLTFTEAMPGSRIEGALRRRVDLVSGRFALVEQSRDFTLVPWRPVLERQIGKPVSGILRGDGVNWTLGRTRGGPVIE
ncbi:relaxase/mobilization nuclease RlxS [Sphingomonas immobilis]|uniref:Relaxase/mobilization nuclease RlxS n=1 Tax=Sphingomonas immobilis TaxID=3063997 RepID=A0ABT9A164_9SPHN|nr:relaxase/mobilization nuclease RlxS [Sphingomonas sp. CA1-15]MDO7843568.1 relaxase/mobilization nuclease RlxS [Sphingomonas sp. CA1-15]